MLNNLAWAYSEKGDFDRAIPLARKAWSLNPDNPATADTLGWLLFKSGEDPAQGLALLEQAARGAPSDGEIQRHLVAAQRVTPRIPESGIQPFFPLTLVFPPSREWHAMQLVSLGRPREHLIPPFSSEVSRKCIRSRSVTSKMSHG